MSRTFRTCLVVIATNLIPVVGVWLFGWELKEVLAYFLAEMLLFGVLACGQLALRGEFTLGPMVIPFIFSFLLIQLFSMAFPLVELDQPDDAAQARAWIAFVGTKLGLALIGVLGSRVVLWGLQRVVEDNRPIPSGGDAIETGMRSLVMFFGVFFTLYFYQGEGGVEPVVMLHGLVIGKIIFEAGVEIFRDTDDDTPTESSKEGNTE